MGCVRMLDDTGYAGGVKKSVEQAEVDVSKQLYKLQNGSDVRGVAVAGVPDEPVTLTPLAAFMIARGFGVWVGEKLGIPPSGLRVSVGSDPRISSEPLKTAVLVGLASLGCSVADFGLATTPAMFFSTIATGHKYDGAIMLTASHLPFNRNGMKFFTADGGLEKANIKELLATAVAQAEERGLVLNNPRVDPGFVLKQALLQDPMALSQVEFLPEYSAFLRGLIKAEIDAANFDRPLDGFKIVVDAGNGSGGFFASQVLEPLGADVSASQFLEPDGMFPNHVPNPEDSGAMQATMAAVNAAGADLGIVFDTDVDRSGIVDNRGSAINSNRFIALMASVVLKQHPGSTIVTDSVTSNGLSQFIEKLGGKHFRYRRGYKNVIGKGVELNTQGVDCELMMETSGHGAMRSNYYLDDGAYLAVMVVIEMVRRRLAGQGGVGELLDELAEPKEAAEMRLRINSDDFKDVAAAVLQRFHDWVEDGAGGAGTWALEPVNHEGWRVAIDEGDGCKGWVLLRASLHDPILVVNAESDVAGGLVPIREKLLEFCAAASIPSDDLPVNIASIQT